MFCFFGGEACEILTPQPGIKPKSPALEGSILTTGLPGKSPQASSCPSITIHLTSLSSRLCGRAGLELGSLTSCFATPEMCNDHQNFSVCGNIIKVNAEDRQLCSGGQHIHFSVEWNACFPLSDSGHLKEPSCSVIDAPFLSLCFLTSKAQTGFCLKGKMPVLSFLSGLINTDSLEERWV